METVLHGFKGRSARSHCAEIVIHLGFNVCQVTAVWLSLHGCWQIYVIRGIQLRINDQCGIGARSWAKFCACERNLNRDFRASPFKQFCCRVLRIWFQVFAGKYLGLNFSWRVWFYDDHFQMLPLSKICVALLGNVLSVLSCCMPGYGRNFDGPWRKYWSHHTESPCGQTFVFAGGAGHLT